LGGGMKVMFEGFKFAPEVPEQVDSATIASEACPVLVRLSVPADATKVRDTMLKCMKLVQ
jgi:hypothetical protein